MRTIEILTVPYSIEFKSFNEDPQFKNHSWIGYCDFYGKRIVICNPDSIPWFDKSHPKRSKTQMWKHALRHEIVHAFLNESGLEACAFTFDGPWPKNEEMIDWIACQAAKIVKAWREAGAL